MVDARGLLCPMPVVMVQKAVKDGHPAEIEVLLDDACAVENVTRSRESATKCTFRDIFALSGKTDSTVVPWT